jgi:hypothetical protein
MWHQRCVRSCTTGVPCDYSKNRRKAGYTRLWDTRKLRARMLTRITFIRFFLLALARYRIRSARQAAKPPKRPARNAQHLSLCRRTHHTRKGLKGRAARYKSGEFIPHVAQYAPPPQPTQAAKGQRADNNNTRYSLRSRNAYRGVTRTVLRSRGGYRGAAVSPIIRGTSVNRGPKKEHQ